MIFIIMSYDFGDNNLDKKVTEKAMLTLLCFSSFTIPILHVLNPFVMDIDSMFGFAIIWIALSYNLKQKRVYKL